MKSSYIQIFAVMLTLTFASCKESDIVWNPDDVNYRHMEVAGPAVKLHVPLLETIRKNLDFQYLKVDDDGVICVEYTKSENIKWGGEDDEEELGVISGIARNWNDIPFVSEFMTGTVTREVLLASSSGVGSYVTKAELQSGSMSFQFNPTGNIAGNAVIAIPELKKNGVSFEESVSLTEGGVFPLEGYVMETDADHNINVAFSVEDDATGNGMLNIEFRLTDLYVTYLSGYFGEMTETQNDFIDLDFFNELEFDGVVGIRDIKMQTEITNLLGMPMDAEGSFNFVNYGNITMTPPFAFGVDGATEGNNHTVVPAVKTFSTTLGDVEFNSENGYPSQLQYSVTGKGNPQGNIGENFIVYRSEDEYLAKVDLTLTIPLHIKASAYSRKDTIAFDYADLTQDNENGDYSKSIDEVAVSLKINNRLPFEVSLQAIAIDGAAVPQEVESLLDKTTIAANGETAITVKLDQTRIERIRAGNVKNLILITNGKTANEDYVKVTQDAFIDISVTVDRFASDIPSNIIE